MLDDYGSMFLLWPFGIIVAVYIVSLFLFLAVVFECFVCLPTSAHDLFAVAILLVSVKQLH